MNKNYYKLTTQLPSKTIADDLQTIAFNLGYIQTRGPEAGKVGSISQLLEAIAKGEIRLEGGRNDVRNLQDHKQA